MGLFQRKSEEKRSLDEILSERDNAIENENAEEAESGDCPIKQEESVTKKHEEEFNVFKCFGWEQDKTPKWMRNCANVWYWLMSFFWFLVGATTFAPIMFIRNKIKSVVKGRLNSLIGAMLLYLIIIAIILVVILR